MKVFICGFSGSGKSTFLKQIEVEADSDVVFVDLDLKIENDNRRSISQIVSEEGWEKFRTHETFEIESILKSSQKNIIVALGGGALSAKNCETIIQNQGYILWLDTPFHVCWQRIREDMNRPLVQAGEVEMKALYELRAKEYMKSHSKITDLEALKIVNFKGFINYLDAVQRSGHTK